MVHQFVEKIISEDLENTFARIGYSRRRQHFEAAAPEKELDLGKRQRIVRAVAGDLAQLIRLGAQKLAASGDIEKKILNRNLGPLGKGALSLRHDLAARDFN